MSHTVTVTRTVTSSNQSSALVLNTGYVMTLPGFVKVLQLFIGGCCIGLIAFNYKRYYWNNYKLPDAILLVMAGSFWIGTFCLLLSYLLSFSSAKLMAKTVYETFYHAVGAVCILIPACYFVNNMIYLSNKNTPFYQMYMTTSVLGVMDGMLYGWSAVLARKSYHG